MPNLSGIHDPGREFEQRAADLARAIHDPSGQHGSSMIGGKERDGLFIDENAVFTYEFTTRTDKAKAQTDGQKLAELLVGLRKTQEHQYKAMQGRFVTESEPTADQREALRTLAQQHNVILVAMSLVSLRKHMIDTEEYIRLRLQAPFGSAGSSMQAVTEGAGQKPYVEATFRDRLSGEEQTATSLAERLATSDRLVIGGDFGIGKSAALAHLFALARRAYFKKPSERRFPIHINLRDLHGLRSASEVLRRHCEEIGFQNERSLIAAWRAGCCDLLLDGFDELVPVNYVGGVKDLAAVRKRALEPVRQLVLDSPSSTGIVIAGRTQYFSSSEEIFESLGLKDASILDLQNFSESQVREFLGDNAKRLPEWVPTRPVLLQFWLQLDMGSSFLPSPGQAWREFVVRVAEREGERVQSITADNLLRLITGVATRCQADGTIYSGVSLSEMTDIFQSVFHREPDEEGIQTLMRLPGLVPVEGPEERRRFIDEDLQHAAFGIEMAGYILSPDAPHTLNQSGHWTTASSGLVGEVAAAQLLKLEAVSNQCVGAIKSRVRKGLFDAPLLEIARCADVMDAKQDPTSNLFISGVMIPYLNANGEGIAGSASFSDCLIDELDLSSLDLDSHSLPTFLSCAIHLVSGQSSLPDRLIPQFRDCEIDRFSTKEQTTDGILEMGLPMEERVGLTILRKVFAQRGSGRKLSALSRGLPPQDRALVPRAIDRLESLGYLTKGSGQSSKSVLPVSTMRAQALRILENLSQGIPDY